MPNEAEEIPRGRPVRVRNRVKRTEIYNVLKVAEGGMGQRDLIQHMKEAGLLNIKPRPSCYVGQTAATGKGTELQHERASNLIYRVGL